MAYTAAQYAAQERLMVLARWANATGLCPVCRVRPQAVWPDGVPRITCGDDACYERWLAIRPPAHSTPADAVGVDSHAAPAGPTQNDGFTVGLIIG